MLKIRLQRIGKRGQAHFRVVVTEHTTKPKGKYLELLGSYDPHQKKIKTDADRIKHWISKGAHMSPTVNNLLVGNGIIEGQKVKAWKAKKSDKPQETKASQASPAQEQPPAEAMAG